MEGQIDEFVETLRTSYQTKKLKAETVAGLGQRLQNLRFTSRFSIMKSRGNIFNLLEKQRAEIKAFGVLELGIFYRKKS